MSSRSSKSSNGGLIPYHKTYLNRLAGKNAKMSKESLHAQKSDNGRFLKIKILEFQILEIETKNFLGLVIQALSLVKVKSS